MEILSRPNMGEVVGELLMFMTPLWVAVIVGVLVGWAWKPKWANLAYRDLIGGSSKDSDSNSNSSSVSSLNFLKFQLPSCISGGSDEDSVVVPASNIANCRFVSVFCWIM